MLYYYKSHCVSCRRHPGLTPRKLHKHRFLQYRFFIYSDNFSCVLVETTQWDTDGAVLIVAFKVEFTSSNFLQDLTKNVESERKSLHVIGCNEHVYHIIMWPA